MVGFLGVDGGGIVVFSGVGRGWFACGFSIDAAWWLYPSFRRCTTPSPVNGEGNIPRLTSPVMTPLGDFSIEREAGDT